MIVHPVLFRPKPTVSDADRQAMVEALSTASREIPSVRRFEIGRRLTHGAAYEALTPPDFPYACLVAFDNLAGLQAYLSHPQHDALAKLFYQLQDAALVYDFEVGDEAANMRVGGATL